MAKRMKFSVVGLPHYTIWHLYEPSVDDLRHMEQMEVERLAREKEEQERAEQKDNVQSKPTGTDQIVDSVEGQGSTEDLAGQSVKAVDSAQGHLKAQAETVDQAEKVEVVEKATL
jgi:mannan polymerase II complex ANP1 subunit